MKTKPAIEAIKRTWVLFQIRSLEATLDGQNQALRLVECQCTRWKIEAARMEIEAARMEIEAARMETKRGLAALRTRYSRMLPPGKTVIWMLA